MKARALAAVLAAAMMATGCPKKAEQAPAQGGARRAARVTTSPVTKTPLSWKLEVIGSVEAREEVSVAAGVPGIAEKVAFAEGDDVTLETVLVTIDEERYTLEEKRAEADLARAQADVERTQIVYTQRLPLHQQKFISDEELADVKAALARANAERARAEATLSLARKAVRDCRVRPSIAGKINGKRVSTGEYVKAETVVATIVDLSELRVRFAVPESDARRLVPKLKVTFTSRMAQTEKTPGEIFWVNQVADENTRTVTSLARLEGSPAGLRPGMSGIVSLTLDNREGCIVVPVEAVLPTERGFVAFVFEGGKARERRMKLGIQTEDGRVEVLEGIKEGDTIIVRGAAALRDGQDVEVVK